MVTAWLPHTAYTSLNVRLLSAPTHSTGSVQGHGSPACSCRRSLAAACRPWLGRLAQPPGHWPGAGAVVPRGRPPSAGGQQGLQGGLLQMEVQKVGAGHLTRAEPARGGWGRVKAADQEACQLARLMTAMLVGARATQSVKQLVRQPVNQSVKQTFIQPDNSNQEASQTVCQTARRSNKHSYSTSNSRPNSKSHSKSNR